MKMGVLLYLKGCCPPEMGILRVKGLSPLTSGAGGDVSRISLILQANEEGEKGF
jgi:hypothetical protein